MTTINGTSASASPVQVKRVAGRAGGTRGSHWRDGLRAFVMLFLIVTGALAIGLALGEIVYGRHVLLKLSEWRCTAAVKGTCVRFERVGAKLRPVTVTRWA